LKFEHVSSGSLNPHGEHAIRVVHKSPPPNLPCLTALQPCLLGKKQVFATLLYIYLSHYFIELQNTEKRLAKTREKLNQIQTGQHNVRGKDKKVEAMQKIISDLELKVSALQNAGKLCRVRWVLW